MPPESEEKLGGEALQSGKISAFSGTSLTCIMRRRKVLKEKVTDALKGGG